MNYKNLDNTDPEKEYKKQLYNIYREERGNTERNISNQRAEFDRQLINVSTWAFGLTLIYFSQVSPDSHSASTAPLFIGLGLLILTILSVMISFYTSNWMLKEYIRKVEDEFLHDKKVDWDKRTLLEVFTSIFNMSSIVMFIGGLASIFIFVLRTIKGGNQ